MTQEELTKLLEAHKKWLTGEEGGRRAKLDGANLTRANLDGANLTRANLTRANLTRANLDGANLWVASLTRANLKETLGLPAIDVVEGLREKIHAAATAPNCSVNMESWHTCETTHCIAGWVTALHPQGKLLESIYYCPAAAALILNACGESIPNFYDTSPGCNGRALEWMKTGTQPKPEDD